MLPPRIVIIGAGISGLSVAYRLQQQAPEAHITVLEQTERPGGTAWTLREDGFQLEIGPNGFLDSKPSTLQLCRDLGLGDRLVLGSEGAARNRFIHQGSELKRLPNGIGSLFTSNLLSWRGKARLMLEPWRRPGPVGADESITKFVRRRAGQEAADVFADALVTGIYAGDPQLLSLPACFPRASVLEREHGSLMRGFIKTARQRRRAAVARGEVYERPGKMWSLRGGLRVLIEAMNASLKKEPLYGINARALERTGNSARAAWLVQGEGQTCWEADAVILTCPAPAQAALLAGLDPVLADEVAAIPYNRVAMIGLGYRRRDVPVSLNGFGYIAPQNTRRDVLGVQWCSSIFPERAPQGAVLLRAMCGGWHRADVVGWDDNRLLNAVRADLKQTLKITAAPIFARIIRWERAIPQYHVGHLARLQRIDERLRNLPGLFLGGNAYRGVALNDCTEQGELLAKRVREYLAK
jgi:oxygen-dependent protoporphyrinogen oxidase